MVNMFWFQNDVCKIFSYKSKKVNWTNKEATISESDAW